MNGLADFVSGGYPLPWTPVISMGEFVAAEFPLPQNPVYFASSKGSLPKAPDMPMALIAHGNGASLGCGCGGSCAGCGGLGGLGDTLIPQASLPTFLQGDALVSGIPTVYLAAGVLLAAVLFMGGRSARRGRR